MTNTKLSSIIFQIVIALLSVENGNRWDVNFKTLKNMPQEPMKKSYMKKKRNSITTDDEGTIGALILRQGI